MNARTKTVDEKFCQECGEVIRAKAEICPKCGVRQPSMPTEHRDVSGIAQGQPRSKSVAGLLGLFLGGLGIHKFYMGKPIWGVVYILFCWTLVPAIVGFIEGLNFLMMSDRTFNERHSGPAWTTEDGPTPDTHIRCPDCKELIFKDARVCKHCGCKLIPQL